MNEGEAQEYRAKSRNRISRPLVVSIYRTIKVGSKYLSSCTCLLVARLESEFIDRLCKCIGMYFMVIQQGEVFNNNNVA